MRASANDRTFKAALIFLLVGTLATHGCSRKKYRLQADGEAYDVIAERNADPRWKVSNYSIDIDPRSRYFDPYDPDCPPMPKDDPTAQQYMRLVDGKTGWAHWNDNGNRVDLENPEWKETLAEYVNLDKDGSVKLNVESALKLAYVHSPSHQRQLETLYLSALDVSAERFRLDSQFFGGYDLNYAHNGSLVPAGIGFDSAAGGFVVNPPVDVDGLENNRLTLGRPSAGDPALLARRRFASAGELLVGFANSFVFEVTGQDASLASSLANFTFVQPLLRGAGRDIALEQLTFDERKLLSNLRAYGQFRQGFYTLVAIGEVGVSGPQRGGVSPSLQVFSGQNFVGGYIGLLQRLQEIRNSQDNLDLQLRTLKQLEALLAVGVIDLVQVDQFRQSVQSERANLLRNRNSLQLSLDRYKVSTLGLPPNLNVALDDTLLRQFQLVSRESTALQDLIVRLQEAVGDLPANASLPAVQQITKSLIELLVPIRRQLDSVQSDLIKMNQAAPTREKNMTQAERKAFQTDTKLLLKTLDDVQKKFKVEAVKLNGYRNGLTEKTRAATTNKLVVWIGNILRLVQRSDLVQARARLEMVTIETIELKSEEAFKIALGNRLDFMNGRAALVDRWRLIQVRADALQSVLNVTASGNVRTARNKPFDFKAPTGTLRLGLEFDAPFTRLLERNAYREALIEYQRGRRDFIQSRDSLHLGLRELIRQVEQLRTNLEIQRRAVAIAIRRVDLTRADLYAPVPPPQPGRPAAQFGPTAARNLLTSLSSLRDTQNSLLNVWLSYYATRMRLSREMGTMLLDRDGKWVEDPTESPQAAAKGGNGQNTPELPPRTSRIDIRRLPPTW